METRRRKRATLIKKYYITVTLTVCHGILAGREGRDERGGRGGKGGEESEGMGRDGKGGVLFKNPMALSTIGEHFNT